MGKLENRGSNNISKCILGILHRLTFYGVYHLGLTDCKTYTGNKVIYIYTCCFYSNQVALDKWLVRLNTTILHRQIVIIVI